MQVACVLGFVREQIWQVITEVVGCGGGLEVVGVS